MPRADIKTKQAFYTLSQLHAELAGKFLENERQRVRLKTAMMQVEAVLLMLQPIQHQEHRRQTAEQEQPWFSAGRYSGAPWTCCGEQAVREIAQALIADMAVPATRKQFVDLQAAVHVAEAERRNCNW